MQLTFSQFTLLLYFYFRISKLSTFSKDLLELLFKFYEITINSKILKSPKLKSIVFDIIESALNTKFTSYNLLFRATEHNFDNDQFHAMCEGEQPTVTIVSTSDNYIFGAFNTVNFDDCMGSFADVEDENALLFCLQTPNNNQILESLNNNLEILKLSKKQSFPIVLKCISPEKAMFYDFSDGPAWNYELRISGDNYMSSSDGGYYFRDCKLSNEKIKELIWGSDPNESKRIEQILKLFGKNREIREDNEIKVSGKIKEYEIYKIEV